MAGNRDPLEMQCVALQRSTRPPHHPPQGPFIRGAECFYGSGKTSSLSAEEQTRPN